MNYNSPREIMDLLTERGFSPQKKFGQNFLVSESARIQIIESLGIMPGHYIWEIGPGLGAMTELALGKTGPGGRLVVFEIDRGYAGLLRDIFRDRIEIVEGDMLKTWKSCRESGGPPDRIFGNLPYNAASAMIASLIEEKAEAGKMVFTVQKEAARRMAALPGSSDYSSFSVLCALACDVKIETDLKGGSFYPVPDVTSSVVSMVPHGRFREVQDRRDFSVFLRMLFNSRRKTIFNNLKSLGKEKARSLLSEAGIPESERAEKLDIDSIVSLYLKQKTGSFNV